MDVAQVMAVATEPYVVVQWQNGDVSYVPYPGGTEHARHVAAWVAAGGVIEEAE